LKRYRRLLLDMHIPDWDDAFLAEYDPKRIVATYKRAGADSVMIYCQSHTGLAYWPTEVGTPHRALQGRDLVGETLSRLREADIEAFSYYSLTYNNLAFHNHPDWRLVPAAPIVGGGFAGKRYGIVCPNSREYREFALSEVRELIERYDFDGVFFDMTFWPAVCICPSCSDRYRSETGSEIPMRVDWLSDEWCRFQETRQRWLVEYAREFSSAVKEIRPELPVFHNSAVALFNWTRGFSFEMAEENDFLGGDFYGDSHEQLLVSKLMTNLSNGRPVEFMTSVSTHLTDHGAYKPPLQLELQALSCLLFSAALRFIDAVNPDGTICTGAYEVVGGIFERLKRYEPFLGGTPVEEIAVYLSDRSKMSFVENGTALEDPTLRSSPMPHIDAAKGAVRALQEAHLPFGVITKKQLSSLGRYRVVVLPNVLRMDEREVEALRGYVKQGGCVYASGLTSLTTTDGTRRGDFMLGELFSCTFDGSVSLPSAYVRLTEPGLKALIAPREHLAVKGFPAVALHGKGSVLAELTLPYGYPEEGSVFDRSWASIHSSPPWTTTGVPMVVESRFGKGRVIYSSAALEGEADPFHARLFVGLVRRLFGGIPFFEATTHPAVWMSVHRQQSPNRLVFAFLNYQEQLPPIPIANISVRLHLPVSNPLPAVTIAPERKELHTVRLDDDSIEFVLDRLDTFSMVVVE